MNKKEINISIPKGYEIDKKKSTFEKIVFKKIRSWKDDISAKISGFFIDHFTSKIILSSSVSNSPQNYNTFATEKQAKSALAMARISQIMANDVRFGGNVTDKEWNDSCIKYTISRRENNVHLDFYYSIYQFLAFHTKKQRDLFMKENMDLIKDYLMLD